MIIGILALQGDFHLHAKLLTDYNISNIYVTKPKQLLDINALIIPGGESTVILSLLLKYDFINHLNKFSKIKSIYGSCAGAIIMSKFTNDKMNTLNYIDIKSNRNYWGSQINSFTDKINFTFNKSKFNAYFIRAPKFECLSDKLEVLSMHNDVPILIRNKRHLVSSFHPEMTDDFTVHEYFIGMING